MLPAAVEKLPHVVEMLDDITRHHQIEPLAEVHLLHVGPDDLAAVCAHACDRLGQIIHPHDTPAPLAQETVQPRHGRLVEVVADAAEVQHRRVATEKPADPVQLASVDLHAGNLPRWTAETQPGRANVKGPVPNADCESLRELPLFGLGG